MIVDKPVFLWDCTSHTKYLRQVGQKLNVLPLTLAELNAELLRMMQHLTIAWQ